MIYRRVLSPHRRLKQIGVAYLVLLVSFFLSVGFFCYSRLKSNVNATSSWVNIAENKADKVANKLQPNTQIRQPSAITSTKEVKKDELSCVSRYQSCPNSKPGFIINVHLIPHTHDDVGWRKTFEDYYTGGGHDMNPISIMKIIDSVVDELHVDPSRRFIYVEMAYFSKWWIEQSTGKKQLVRNMVNSGRLEFINGGWCMNDEATTHYVDIIDQMSLGLKFLNQTFGKCGRPKIGWQIDPFGHSKEHASINSQLGFDGLILGRIDYQDRKQRIASKNLEMVWLCNKNSKTGGGIFTSLLYDHYSPPSGFCFDGELNYCNDKPINDDPNSKDYDVKERVANFLKFCQQQADAYKTNNILVPMGNDFTYQNASNWFINMDKLIKHGNKFKFKGDGSTSKFNIFYSTPSCYAKAVSDQNVTWPIKNDDFFPYGFNPNSYWTGFYTSRPTFKHMVRQGSNLLQSCKQMASVLAMKGKKYKGDISVMKEAMAVMQHHDAVTGTEKQHVADDYVRLLHMGVEQCLKTETSFYEHELPKENETSALPQVSYCRLNLSECEVTEKSERFVVNVYNSLSRAINKYVRFPIPDKSTSQQVFDSKGNPIPWQLVPIPNPVKKLPDRKSPSNRELVFLAVDLPPLGSKSFYVQSTLSELGDVTHDYLNEIGTESTSESSADYIISNEIMTVTVDKISGLLRSVETNNVLTKIKQEFLWYAGKMPVTDENNISQRPSGAYNFRPNGTSPFTIPNDEISNSNDEIRVTSHKGALVEEIHQYYNDWLSQVIRLYRGQNHVELDWIVGPIPTNNNVSKEIITRFTTSMKSNREFYTDSNGRQTVKRKINSRDSFQYNVTEPVAGNYYPVNSHIYLKDQKEEKQLNILVDRAQGGASLEEGQIELMVHRRLFYDDLMGVEEALDEKQSNGNGIAVRGTHFLMLGGNVESDVLRPLLIQELYKQPRISFMATDLSLEDWFSRYNTEVQFLSRGLPENVNLLTLEPYSNETFFIRLEHIYEEDADESLSAPVNVSLAKLFKSFEITSLEETFLGGNMLKKELNQLKWNTKSKNDKTSANAIEKFDDFSNGVIVLHPMQIRSFILGIAKREQR